MSLRNEQCNKVCRILDDVLANRPTERDSLITAARKAFGALEPEPHWIPCSERLPERADNVIICYKAGDYTLVSTGRYLYKFKMWYVDVVGDLRDGVTAWMPLPEPYKEEGDT